MTLIAFATCIEQPGIQPGDNILARALEARGARVVAAPWNGGFTPFAKADAIVVRSTWDYHHAENTNAFESWLDRLRDVRGKVFNPPLLMRWNAPKTYLVDLAARGAPLPPTLIVEGAADAITVAMDELRLDEAVVKPVYGGTARGLSIVKRADRASIEKAAAILDHQAMVQAIIREIAGGETSMVFLGGAFSHAVVKRPLPGDIRSQREFGGSVLAVLPPAWAIGEAERILALLPEQPLYARVDAVLLDGRLWLMEVEVIEPELFFDHDSGAAERFADILLEQLKA